MNREACVILMTALTAAALVAAEATPSPLLDPTLCDDAAQRDRILNGDAISPEMMGQAHAYNAAQQATLDTKMDELGMSEQERATLALKVLNTPAFNDAFEKGIALQKVMMSDLQKIMASKDAMHNCRVILHMTGLLPEIMASAEAQWAVFRTELDAEAIRRGKVVQH